MECQPCDTGETITVANSKFENNGNPDPSRFQRALSVNHAGRLTVTGSLFCGQLIRHDPEPRQAGATPVNPSGCGVFK
jgi:hypothetical protein